MNNFFNLIGFNLKQKKGLFLLILLLTIITIVLAIFAGINFSEGIFTVDLSNICYIQFLKGDCGWFGLFFGLVFSLMIFALLITIFSCKPFLFPIAILFYLYLVYSQVVVVISLIVIYGILNCVILVLLLTIYNIILIALYLLILLDLNNHHRNGNYFSNCFNLNISIVPICLIAVLILCFVFSLILIILKSFVLLLVF